MQVSNTCGTDLVGTVYHDMGTAVRSYCFINLWSPVMGEQRVLEKEPASQSIQ